MRNGFIFICSLFFFTMYCADLDAQTCYSSIPASTPDWQLTDNGNTVTDIKTGLMWKKCLEGLWGNSCENGNNIGRYSWEAALKRANDSGFAEHDDWRLPNIKELNSIVEEKCHAPAINLNRFPNTPPGTNEKDPDSFVWSGSPSLNDQDGVVWSWSVGFFKGFSVFSKRTDRLAVRLVRTDTEK